MPARTANKGWDFTTSNGVKGQIFHIKVPYPVIVRIKLDCFVDKSLGNIVPTSPKSIMANYEDKDIIMKNLKQEGINVVDVEQMSFGPLVDLCQKCGKRGIPSIQKKNTDQKYVKVNDEYSIELVGKIVKIPKPKTYWLTYRHKSGRCWVRQWQGTIKGTFKEPKKSEYIHPRKFMISGQIEELENLSF